MNAKEQSPAQIFLKNTTYPEACRLLNRLLRAVYALDANEIRACREIFLQYREEPEEESQERLW